MIGRNEAEEDGAIASEIESLRQHMMRRWWWICLALWLTVGVLSLWWVRADLQELREYFTWAAVRSMLANNRAAAAGIGLCYGLTLALLYAESRHILLGLSRSERQQLTSRLKKIRKQGPSHPQWKIIHSGRSQSARR